MKKVLFMISVAAVALASCSNEKNEYVGGNDNSPKEIAFKPITQPATRGASAANIYNAVPSTDYPKNYTMDVVAYMVPESGTSDVTAGDYFGSTNFLYQNAGGSTNTTANPSYWGGATAQYWPMGRATLNFLAVSQWSPTNVVSTVFGETSADYASKATVTLSNNKPTSYTPSGSAATYVQHDLMYAIGSASVTKNGSTQALEYPSYVNMVFKHALAWIYFTVQPYSAAEEAITVNSITLTNAYYSGEFVANQTNYDALTGQTWGTCKWNSVGSKEASITSPNWTAAVLDWNESGSSPVVTPVGDGIIVVPTVDLTGSDAKESFDNFTINYTVGTGVGAKTYNYTYTPATRTLEKGKKYTYAITFKLNEIFINASVENWTSSSVNVPVGGSGS